MSAITIEDDLVHYEVLGRGKPIVLLHGWLGSWRYWVPTMQQLTVKYRCYALDLWGFGDSGKDPARYTLERQVRLIDQFLDEMEIPKVVLVGHALGQSLLPTTPPPRPRQSVCIG
ncbi:MAG: alpha/beta fold hydrolase [Anaerolineae bacterium]|nr:alpha/beta fold hydrolase [Anaerolineae bacterium]